MRGRRGVTVSLVRAAARVSVVACLVGVITFGAVPQAQSVAAKDTALMVRRALSRLPYYGVFDFLAVKVDAGTVTLQGYAYRPQLKPDAVSAAKKVAGVDEVVDRIELLPSALRDDRIRRATFDAIYGDEFLSRYVSGGPIGVRYEAMVLSRFPGMEPIGSYPIHIIVKNGRTMLLGVVDSEADKTFARVRARGVVGVLGVDDDVVIGRS
jgi:hyperosmotically inducible periplasmic protein